MISGILVEVFNLFFVDCDRKYFLLLKLIRMCFVAFYYHEAMIFMELYFARSKEDFGEEVLFFEDFFIVGLL